MSSPEAGSNRPTVLEKGSELDEFVTEHDLALVEFYTEGCSICQSMEPILGNVHRNAPATVGTINPRNDPPLIDEYNVRSVPLFVLFVDGEPVDRLAEGFVETERLVTLIESHAT
ncbi:thioredoxin family protein [Natranaeroarchaeum sulfidigenes]|uniref:Thiol-disulfide isomerase or thioredoxin n=1 Tax=Natranaeroarchaeum sulfidigenes TaxID=2784880 RepID=A0A897MN50_9EURY|nr:thioredoxin family protein [Natranaeroarchaeum sulfidigenes]QSG01832.1 Thiol-disulfide isomerase or thioredoxin [Natranaeroarchaeum sulfidigenes]